MDPRERMLEGFLARLSRAPDADAFALRGGMLVRTWVPDASRAIRDIDLTCALPLDRRSIRRHLRGVLVEREPDGVAFDAEHFRIDWWPDHAGITLYAAGDVDGNPAELAADVWFGLELQIQRGEVTTARGPIPFGLCSHELVVASKLAVIAELGSHAWRPKDLLDIWIATKRFSLGRSVGEAIERRCGDGWRELLSAAWWSEPRAEMRWVRDGFEMPLAVVANEVRSSLRRLS